MKDIYESTQEIFDWYKLELSKLAKIVNGYEEHRKIVFNTVDYLTNVDTGLPCLSKIHTLLRSNGGVNLKKCFWVSESKRDKIRTFEYFAKILISEKQDRIGKIRDKFGYIIDLKHFE